MLRCTRKPPVCRSKTAIPASTPAGTATVAGDGESDGGGDGDGDGDGDGPGEGDPDTAGGTPARGAAAPAHPAGTRASASHSTVSRRELIARSCRTRARTSPS